MKKVFAFIIAIHLLSFSNPLQAQENFKWKEMNDFHNTAMKSFHSAEISKLQPTRDSAAAILDKATLWAKSGVPGSCNADVVKPMLATLVDECKAINDAVAGNKSDSVLQPLVIKAHNNFHAIMTKCK